ncbi:MAG: GtrA family protein [Bacteroides caccae]|nr:GtrA family protein [Bacteroides caccae]
MKTKPLVKEFIRFGVVGVLATALHYGIYYFLQSFINVNVAYTTGYVISFIVNFYLTSYFTFGTTPSWKKLVGMGGKAWAPVPVFAIAIPVNFLFVRFVFKHKKL